MLKIHRKTDLSSIRFREIGMLQRVLLTRIQRVDVNQATQTYVVRNDYAQDIEIPQTVVWEWRVPTRGDWLLMRLPGMLPEIWTDAELQAALGAQSYAHLTTSAVQGTLTNENGQKSADSGQNGGI